MPRAILVMALVTPALDLFALVQPSVVAPNIGAGAAAVAALALLGVWAHYPRASWLAAASLAGLASVVLHFLGADIAPALSLLAVVALGLGGAFAPGLTEPEIF